MTYEEDLSHPNWRNLRERLFKKANYKCSKCSRQGGSLEIHHKYYVDGKRAWEYPEDAFEVLCTKHHAEVHGRAPKYCKDCFAKGRKVEIEDKFDRCFKHRREFERKIESDLIDLKQRLGSLGRNEINDEFKRKLDNIQAENNDINKLSQEFDALKKEIQNHLRLLQPTNKINEPSKAYISKKPEHNKYTKFIPIFIGIVLITFLIIFQYNQYQYSKSQDIFSTYIQNKFNREYFSSSIDIVNDIKLIKVSYSFADRGNIFIYGQYCGHVKSDKIVKLPESVLFLTKSKYPERLFILIGTGSDPARPESIFIIPIRDLSSNKISIGGIEKYRRSRTNSNFYYDIKSDILK